MNCLICGSEQYTSGCSTPWRHQFVTSPSMTDALNAQIADLMIRLGDTERELASVRARKAERLRKCSTYWLTVGGREEIREKWSEDSDSGMIQLTLLCEVERLELALQDALHHRDVYSAAWRDRAISAETKVRDLRAEYERWPENHCKCDTERLIASTGKP